MRGCVAHNDLWPCPISSRSFGLDLEKSVRSVASTVLDGFFLYLAQMITIIRGCVECDVCIRIWKFEFLANFWNFSALTFNKKSTVLDGFFPYLAQMITSMREFVAYNDLWPWPISSRSFGFGLENCVRSVASTVLKFQFFASFSNFSAFTLKKNLQFCLHSFHILHKSLLASEGVSHVMTFDLDLFFQGHLALTLKIASSL